MTQWAALAELIEKRDVDGVVKTVRGLDDATRRRLSGRLLEFERRRRTEPGWVFSLDQGLRARFGVGAVLAVAASGVLPPSRLAPLLARTAFICQPDEWNAAVEGVIVMLAEACPGSVPDIATRVAERISPRQRWDDRYLLVSELVRCSGMNPPTSDGFSLHWFRWAFARCFVHQAERGPARELARGPAWVALVDRALGVEGGGTVISDTPGLAEHLARLSDEGRLDRTRLLDTCLARLQRGGRRRDLDGIRALHEALAPSPREVTERAEDYVALLPASQATVAALALRHLQECERQAPLAPALSLAAAQAVLVRPEKGLARTQLAWLEDAARRPGAPLAAVLDATSLAFGHPTASDLQARATDLVLAHAGPLSGPGLHPAEHSDAGPVVPSPGAADVPPIRSVAALAEELAAFLEAPYERARDAVSLERILAALVALGRSDRESLQDGLAPVLDRNRWIRVGPRTFPDDGSCDGVSPRTYDELLAVVGVAVASGPPPAGPGGFEEPPGPWLARVRRMPAGLPTQVLTVRLAELAMGLTRAPVPCLLATPTSADGTLDPDVLGFRLQQLADAGTAPWPRDLAQAVVRLPRAPHPALARRVRSLDLPHGAALAARLERKPRPATITPYRLDPSPRAPHEYWQARDVDELMPPGTVLVRVSPGDPDDEDSWPPEWRALLHVDGPGPLWDHETSWHPVWPAMLPGQREIVAAHLLPHLAERVRSSRYDGAVLPVLADGRGEVGPATHLALCYGLAAADPAARTAAVDALVHLAQRQELDGEWFGTTLGDLSLNRVVSLQRVVPGLRDLGRSGAWDAVWASVAAALAITLPLDGSTATPRLADLLSLGVEAADRVRPAVQIPGLRELGARTGSSHSIVEARRLQRFLDGHA